MGRVSTCQKNCNTIDLRRAQVNDVILVKGLTIKNGCPCIAEIRGTQGCALVRDRAWAIDECRNEASDIAKVQP